MVLGPVSLGALAALVIAISNRRPASHPAGENPTPHRGINMSRIQLAGFPGLVFVLGFVWMFWHGLPGGGPVVVVAVAVLGSLTGLALVFVARRRRPKPISPLGLTTPARQGLEKHERAGEQGDEPDIAPGEAWRRGKGMT
jgi:membrane associated rhomboid family serine protease